MTDADSDQPWKPSPSAADLPELMMFPIDGEMGLTPSGSFEFIQRFQILISSDQMRTNREASPNAVKSAVMSALMGSIDKLPGCNTNFVRPIRWSDVMGTEGEEKRATGWQCVIVVEVHGVQPRSAWV